MADSCECPYDDKVNQTWNSIFVNGHPKGSVMVRMANVETKVDTMEEAIHEIKNDLKKEFDRLGNRVLMILLIVGALIALLQFLGPSLRKTVGLIQTNQPVVGMSQPTSL